MLQDKNPRFICAGNIDSRVTRIVDTAKGSRVQTWTSGEWIDGGASYEDVLRAPPVPPELAERLGIPPADLALISAPECLR